MIENSLDIALSIVSKLILVSPTTKPLSVNFTVKGEVVFLSNLTIKSFFCVSILDSEISDCILSLSAFLELASDVFAAFIFSSLSFLKST